MGIVVLVAAAVVVSCSTIYQSPQGEKKGAQQMIWVVRFFRMHGLLLVRLLGTIHNMLRIGENVIPILIISEFTWLVVGGIKKA